MQIVLCNAHNVLNKRKNLGIAKIYLFKFEMYFFPFRWHNDLISNEDGSAGDCQGAAGDQGSAQRIGCTLEAEIND